MDNLLFCSYPLGECHNGCIIFMSLLAHLQVPRVLSSHFTGHYSTSLWTRYDPVNHVYPLSPFLPVCLDGHWRDLAGFTLGLVGVIMFGHAHVLLDMAQRQKELDLALYQQFCHLSALTHPSREEKL